MAGEIQLPPAAEAEVRRIQRELTPFQTAKWAKDLAEIITLVSEGAFGVAAFELGKILFEIADPKIRREVVTFVTQLSGYVSTLTGIFDSLVSRVINLPQAIVELIEEGFTYTGPDTVQDLERELEQATEGAEQPMALQTLTAPPVCTTGNPRHKGICCAALTQFGAAVAATGFQYTSCTGRTVCMKCGIGTSQSTKHPGRPIFIPRRVQCGPSGCPALGSQSLTA